MPPGLISVPIPRLCEAKRNQESISMEAGGDQCPLDSYVVYPEKCRLVDQQILKIQENPEQVPTGEIPRTFQVCVDRYLCNKMTPGTRVSITGIYQIQQMKNTFIKEGLSPLLKIPYVYALGFEYDNFMNGTSGGAHKSQSHGHFTPEDEQLFKLMAKDPEIYE